MFSEAAQLVKRAATLRAEKELNAKRSRQSIRTIGCENIVPRTSWNVSNSFAKFVVRLGGVSRVTSETQTTFPQACTRIDHRMATQYIVYRVATPHAPSRNVTRVRSAAILLVGKVADARKSPRNCITSCVPRIHQTVSIGFAKHVAKNVAASAKHQCRGRCVKVAAKSHGFVVRAHRRTWKGETTRGMQND